MLHVATATEEHSAAPPADARRHLPGEVGIWVFIFGDMTVFAVLFVTYLYYRGGDSALFRSSQATLDQTYGAINTLILLTSSLLVACAVRAVRQQRTKLVPVLLAGAIVCGIAFSALKVAEWSQKLGHDISPATNDFYMFYFVLTGAALATPAARPGCVELPLLSQSPAAYVGAPVQFFRRRRLFLAYGRPAVDRLVSAALPRCLMASEDSLLRTRASAIWIVLIVATLISWGLGTDHGFSDRRLASSVIVLVAFTKVRLVGLYFMELNRSPVALRLIFEGYCVVVCTAVLGTYLLG